jgi:peptide/nickel transport system permease protein
MVGLFLVVLFCLAAVVGLVYTPDDPYRAHLAQRLKPPSAQHIMGTDGFGRDILSRLLRGAHLALAVGVVSVLIGCVFGSIIGLIAGYFRGWFGAFLMRVTDFLLAFPLILLALTMIATLGPGLDKVMFAVGISTMPRFARMMQSETLSISRREYVSAALAVGSTNWRIVFRHILPNSLSSVLVMATLYVSTAILTEASLSYLGLGPAPPTPTWGSMINDASSVLRTAPWAAFFPALAITIAVLGFSLAGDGLRDAFDTKLRER